MKQEDVRDFHKKFGFPCPDSPEILSAPQRKFRMLLMAEEFREMSKSMEDGNLAEIGAECVDLIYTVIGTAVSYGIDLRPFWEAIHGANMKKVACPYGGKALKPDGWKKPDIDSLL